jgi:phosphoenolpyruvate-protein phosphotransferase (PTS system enzyme I)
MDQGSKIAETVYRGKGLSRGLASGRVQRFTRSEKSAVRTIAPSQVDQEIERFNLAVAKAISQYEETSSSINTSIEPETAEIFEAQSLILSSSRFLTAVHELIRKDHLAAVGALSRVRSNYFDHQRRAGDERFADKQLDLDDVVAKLTAVLTDAHELPMELPERFVVICDYIRPFEILRLSGSNPIAIIAEHGGWTSHSAIIARDLNIPMVSGITNAQMLFAEGDVVTVDGLNGEVTLGHRSTEASDRSSEPRVADDLGESKGEPIVSKDGVRVRFWANSDMAGGIGDSTELEGIGLFRSEFLVVNRGQLPTEEHQYEVYSRIGPADSKVNIRMFDIDPSVLEVDDLQQEQNPALGLRSIRLAFERDDIFRTQARALLRASVNRELNVIIPMVSSVNDLQMAKRLIAEESDALRSKGVPIGEPSIGPMIEIPAAVLNIDNLASESDILCLGTNDLVQYLLAVDRDNENVAEYYRSLDPSVVRAITMVIKAADRHQVPLIVCGEMAASPFYIPLLLHLGIRDLSMGVQSVADAARITRGISVSEFGEQIVGFAELKTSDEVESLLKKVYRTHWRSLFPERFLDQIPA